MLAMETSKLQTINPINLCYTSVAPVTHALTRSMMNYNLYYSLSIFIMHTGYTPSSNGSYRLFDLMMTLLATAHVYRLIAYLHGYINLSNRLIDICGHTCIQLAIRFCNTVVAQCMCPDSSVTQTSHRESFRQR